MLDENHVRVCLEPVNSTSVACDVRAFDVYYSSVTFGRAATRTLDIYGQDIKIKRLVCLQHLHSI